MKIIADLHVHSKYSRATSKEMEIKTLSRVGEMKGVNLIGAVCRPQGSSSSLTPWQDSTKIWRILAENLYVLKP